MSWRIPVGAWDGYATFILGGGPSIKDFDFSRLRGRGKVIAVNNAGLDRASWADVLFWADRRWYEWNRHNLHKFRGTYKITRRPVSDPDIYVLEFNAHSFSHDPYSLGGFCGGSSAINLAYLFGSRVIYLLGFDMTGGNWHNDHRLPPRPGQHRNKFIPVLEFMEPILTANGCSVFNTNPRSMLRCFPFVSIEEVLAMDDVALIEREKYLQVWQRPEYRKVSPGMIEVERAWTVCGMSGWGESLIDFGSGPMRATKWFMERGMRVLGIDFAPNASEHRDVAYMEACLWSLPSDILPVDYGYCCDVMEHIPEQHVASVLNNIARLTRKAAYFRIATRPDRLGPKLIGAPLHVTIQSGEWWRRQIEQFFPLVDIVEMTDRDIMILARP